MHQENAKRRGQSLENLQGWRALRLFLIVGELALLYNAPRAATISALEDSVLFSLDRETFNHIVKDAAAKKREMYEDFLKKVELLESMDPYERSQIADALKPLGISQGSYVFREVLFTVGRPRRLLLLHHFWQREGSHHEGGRYFLLQASSRSS